MLVIGFIIILIISAIWRGLLKKNMEMWLLHGVRILWPVCLSVVVNFLYTYINDCFRSCAYRHHLYTILVSCLIGSQSVSNMFIYNVIQEVNTIVKMRHFITIEKKVIMFSSVYNHLWNSFHAGLKFFFCQDLYLPTGELNTSEIRAYIAQVRFFYCLLWPLNMFKY